VWILADHVQPFDVAFKVSVNDKQDGFRPFIGLEFGDATWFWVFVSLMVII
jgi:hypothetical protein